MVRSGVKNKKEINKIRVGITHGDLNGIGYEVIIKALRDSRMLDHVIPIIYGSSKVASYHRKTLGVADFSFNLIKSAGLANQKRANIINITNEEVKIELGKSSQMAGKLAFLALEQAMKDLKSNNLDAIVTAPINKENIQSESFAFPGHTEYFARQFDVDDQIMLMVCDKFRIGAITGHIPIKDVPTTLTIDLILKKLNTTNKSLKCDFAITKPKIALLGLNPHAGDGGLLGNEEQEIIIPAIEAAREQDILAYGPYSADGFFATNQFRKFDAILAMYHDQGLIPFKTISFEKGVNFTAGLPVIRTSPSHGTAYDIAGKNLASPDSFRQAMFLASEIFNNRTMYFELTNNPLQNYLKEIDNNHKGRISSDAVLPGEKENTPRVL